jgi:hypothetical protein
MFCPKCATQNLEGASYCRSCGANIKLIPQALSGQLPLVQSEEFDFGRRLRRKYGREVTLDRAFKSAFMGIAFLLVSIALSFSPMGRGWWFWMMIPAFSMMGSGIAQYIRVREQGKRAVGGTNSSQTAMPPSRVEVFPERNTGELMTPPPSVTEGTTRHLGAEAPTTKHLDAPRDTSK